MWTRSASEFHVGSWLLWLLAAMLAALSTRNPLLSGADRAVRRGCATSC
jgi:hypothetical protein